MSSPSGETAEWLETDSRGGFVSGTAAGLRTRRYHSLLLPATTPPTGRMVLVSGLDAFVDGPAGTMAITSQRYAPDVVHPDGARRIEAFDHEPWPRWRLRLDDGAALEHELLVHEDATLLTWRLLFPRPALRLRVRPFFSGRDYHSLHHENAAFRFEPEAGEGRWTWRPYPGLPAIVIAGNARYTHAPDWYRSFLYREEQARGLDCVEDLAAPGWFELDLSAGEAFLVLAADDLPAGAVSPEEWRDAERRRRSGFATPLDRAADAYLVKRGKGATIVAGYPWFTDWGRDTFIALRGLCLATSRLDDARDILVEWAGHESKGMLPNRFPDAGQTPEYNAVDAPLWYVVAVHEYLRAAERAGQEVSAGERSALLAAVESLLAGLAQGTRFGIHADGDGLLAAGAPGVQLTWMDAKVGDWVVTPRIGKPVEVQALWLNALWAASRLAPRWEGLFNRGRESFRRRFWNAAGGCLLDVVDVDHRPGAADTAVRPNQILAVGGLPVPLLNGERARRIVDLVEDRLWTPLGLRSLAPGSPGYRPRYEGGVIERDGAYHQGTAWPWLLGPFVEAWVRVRGSTANARRDARARFLTPIFEHLGEAGLGHVSEIADADPPHTPRGCPFQAWSLAEVLRLDRVVLRTADD